MGDDQEPVRTGPREFRERVSDAILGHRDWVYLSGEETQRLPPEVWKGFPAVPRPDAVEAKRHRLSFYEGETLLELCGTGESPAFGPQYFLESKGEWSHLVDGSRYTIPQDYFPTMKLNLSLDNALDYLRFYFFFVHKKHGPVFILDNLDHPAIDRDRLDEVFALEVEEELRAPEVREGPPYRDFSFEVCFLYSDTIYQTGFLLEDGIVDGMSDSLIAEGIPVRRLKDDYRLGQKTLPKVYPIGGDWKPRPWRFLD